jgi:probable HAF family extracellular repeat protein
MRRLIPLLFAVAVLAMASTAWASVYSITDLGTLGGETSGANAINQAGEVAGASETGSFGPVCGSVEHAFRYRGGVMSDTGRPPVEPADTPLGQPPCLERNNSYGHAINDTGAVAGLEVNTPACCIWPGPTVWEADGARRSGGDLGPEWAYPVPSGINDAGEVVGGGRIARLARPGHESITLELFRPPHGEPDSGSASAINNHGEVVGASSLDDSPWGDRHAFVYHCCQMHDLGSLIGREGESDATAINEHGVVVGYSTAAGESSRSTHAFIAKPGTKMKDLGTLPGAEESEAFGINDKAFIIGRSGGHPFLDHAGLMVDLSTLLPEGTGWTSLVVTGINDAYEIVGTGLHNGIERAFLLRPNKGMRPCTPWPRICR